MQNMQKRFGRMTSKRTADDSQVAVLLKDFEDADSLLSKIAESTRAWRDAWVSIATFQSRMADEFDGFYAPIIGSSETDSPHRPVETDPTLLGRTNRLRKEFDELREEMIQELDVVEDRMARPADNAKGSLAPMKKTIKKRNDKKTEFEIYQGKVDSLIHKPKRSDRENANLAKVQVDLASAKEVYQAADQDLRQRLPHLISLLFSLVPFILTAQIEIQNRMLGTYYTVILAFCEETGLPSPPAPFDQIVSDYQLVHDPVQSEIESMNCLIHGKALREAQAKELQNKRPSLGSRTASVATNTSRPSLSSRPSISSISSSIRGKPAAQPPTLGPKPTTCAEEIRATSLSSSFMASRSSVSASIASTSGTSPLPSAHGSWMPPPDSMPSPQTTTPVPSGVSFYPAARPTDHFQHSRSQQSSLQSGPSIPFTNAEPFAMAALKKKKPPPPPRPTFVTALYDFDGQGDDDLKIREGDRIRIVKKTNSTDDWWEGELGGMQGYFPANYVE
ncbi:hypothetical protein N7509_011123 [Penicillium cosmopolitanum]|uniref:SH3 domain-containing protein n=1 Tax=Penicillium cosmopolitanum TaxID=1131564 RepID=A0A9X0B5B4_9EURO|nr:uncharacterized protein N7509_011123 [Penicillium cosmopolitanum]KAJ5388582.1 hypothetical protein N7509_011123 [Penicillium cosmopolitanum]